MNKARAIVILFTLINVLFSQPDTLWTKTYGGGLWDNGVDVYELNNKDLLIIASTSSFGAGYYDIYLIRTDSLGNTIWSKTYGTSDNEPVFASCKGNIGEYYTVGFKGLTGSGSESIYLFKTNENGDSLLVRTYFWGEPSYGFYICPTLDGNYLVCGSVGPLFSGNEDAYVLKINENGDTLWTWRYARPGTQRAYAACNTFDGNYLIEAGDDYTDICLIKMTTDGDTLWTRRYGGLPQRQCAYISPTFDSNYMLVGYIGEYNSGQEDVYLLKVDGNGDSLWGRTYGSDTSDYGQHIYETADTQYLIVGQTNPYGVDTSDVLLIKIDKDGNLLWTKTYGGRNPDYGRRICPTMDGGYLIIGHTKVLADVYLIRLGQEPGINEKQTGTKIILTKLGFPNPVGLNCIIQFRIEIPCFVSLDVYDPSGRLVRKLVSERKEVGTHMVIWNGTDEIGKRCSAGIYFVKLESQWGSDVAKVILIR